jgi:hypothetical protein
MTIQSRNSSPPVIPQSPSGPQATTKHAGRNESTLHRSPPKLSPADVNRLLGALEVDVVALTEIFVPRGYRAEMGMIDAPAIRYNLRGAGRISINRGPRIPLTPHLLIIVPPKTLFAIEVEGAELPLRLMNRECWTRDEGVLKVKIPNEKAELVQICGFFNASFANRSVFFAICANRSSNSSSRRTKST